ncbi:MAG: hypothetical protein AB1758_32975, partial [Candidatus Eremiobacterota bacterium]
MRRVTELLVMLAGACYRRPWLSLTAGLALACLSLGFAWKHLFFDADWISLFPRDDPYRKRIEALHKEFPNPNELMVLVRGGSPEDRQRYVDELARRLEAEPARFRQVFYRLDLKPFREGGFFYLDRTQLARVRAILQSLQPMWEPLRRREGLPGLLLAVPYGLEQSDPTRVRIVLDMVTHTLRQLLACLDDRSGFRYRSAFDTLLSLPDDERYRTLLDLDQPCYYNTLSHGQIHFLLVQPPPSKEASYAPNTPTVDRLRAIL